MVERLKALKDQHVIALLLGTQKRFGEIGGTALANGIALQTFLSLFPLILVAIAVVGYLAAGDDTFASDVISNFSLTADDSITETITTAIDTAAENKEATGVFALAGMLWSGLNVVTAIQRSIDSAWQTKGKGLKNKLLALGWLLGAVVIFTGSFALAAIINFLPGWFAPLSILLGFAVNFGLFLWTFVALGRLHLGVKTMVPGAVLCAVGLEVLKLVGAVYVPRLVASSSALYGPLGIVIAILGWLAFFGRLIVYGAVANVISYEDKHGTVSVTVHAPRVDTAIPLEADRSGAVVERQEAT